MDNKHVDINIISVVIPSIWCMKIWTKKSSLHSDFYLGGGGEYFAICPFLFSKIRTELVNSKPVKSYKTLFRDTLYTSIVHNMLHCLLHTYSTHTHDYFVPMRRFWYLCFTNHVVRYTCYYVWHIWVGGAVLYESIYINVGKWK